MLAFRAISAAFLRTPARALSASCCTTGSMLVCTGVPGFGGRVATVPAVAPAAVTAVTVAPGWPASCCWSANSSPVWPTTLCAV